MQIKILNKLITKDLLPQYATTSSAGMDLRACIEESLTLQPNQSVLISTGISIYIQDKNLVAFIMPRSGLGHKKGLVLGNLTGVIDADYQGELKISLWNRSNDTQTIESLERIAQLIFMPIYRPEFELVDEFTEGTERGLGGYGSTGK
jgi:dUTP pyrophosphatase